MCSWNIIPEAAYDMYVNFTRIYPASNEGVDTGENRPKTEREASTGIMTRLQYRYQSLNLLRDFIEANKTFIFSFLFDQAS